MMLADDGWLEIMMGELMIMIDLLIDRMTDKDDVS